MGSFNEGHDAAESIEIAVLREKLNAVIEQGGDAGPDTFAAFVEKEMKGNTFYLKELLDKHTLINIVKYGGLLDNVFVSVKPEFWNDDEVLDAIMEKEPYILLSPLVPEHVRVRVTGEPAWARKLMSVNGLLLKELSVELKRDPEMIRAALENTIYAIAEIDEEMLKRKASELIDVLVKP